MDTTETTLYIRDNTGSIREWAIKAIDDLITIRYGQMGGSMQYQYERVSEGKASRSLDEQIMSRMASRISKQRDRGYVNSLDKVKDKTTNLLGLPKAMLAHKLRDVKDIDFEGAYYQHKYDGNRCMITNQDGVNIAYSRNGKRVESIEHILQDIQLAPGEIIDGELYCHGYPLQTIVSWIKRKQENTIMLKYHMYDMVMDAPYAERLHHLDLIEYGQNIEIAPTTRIISLEEAMSYFRSSRDMGYEGGIIRWGEKGYEDGKRSKSLVKMKEWHDEEFKVIDIHESADGWGILECILPDSTTFRVSAPGSIPEKVHVLNNRDQYLDRNITVEYAQLTKDGIPFHPVATMWDKHS
ncbi:MAG: hypothetical protein DRI46_09770 [Chloroflexi bacterium]|nr:MAG: hypothetical protein DRI46_09770 [Chloroflexota bacterium]